MKTAFWVACFWVLGAHSTRPNWDYSDVHRVSASGYVLKYKGFRCIKNKSRHGLDVKMYFLCIPEKMRPKEIATLTLDSLALYEHVKSETVQSGPVFTLFEGADTMGITLLRRPIGYNAQEIPQFEEVRVQYDSLNKYYQTLHPYWEAGIGFQLALRHIPNNWWITVFNIDSKGIMIRSNNTMVSEEAIEKAIPNEQVQFKFDEKGTQWLCMIFTKNPFHNFKEFSQKTIDTNPDIIHKQMTFFLNDHISKDISFMSKRMRFTFLKNHEYKGAFILLKIVTK